MLSGTDASRKSGRTFWPEKISNKESHGMAKVTTGGTVFSERTRIESQRSHWHGESRGNKSRSTRRGNLATNLDSWATSRRGRHSVQPKTDRWGLLSAGHKRIKIRCQAQHVTSLANKYLQLTELTSPKDKCKRNLPSESFLRYLSKIPLDATSNIVDRNTPCFDWRQNKQYKRNSQHEILFPATSNAYFVTWHCPRSWARISSIKLMIFDWWFLSFPYVESEHLPLHLVVVLFALSTACDFKLSLI